MINLTIHHADCQKCKVEENILKEKRLNEENENAELKAFEKSVESIFNKIKYKISNTIYGIEHYTVYKDDFYTYTYKTLRDKWVCSINEKEVLNAIQIAFKTAGYEFEWSEYSKAWQTRSGKFCNVKISW